MKLKERQRKFADEYIKTRNITESAINAGYSESYANAQAYKLLDNIGIKTYIEGRMKEIDSKAIADQQEILEMISRIIRDEEEGTALVGIGQGAQAVRRVKPTVTEKMRAAETLGKLYSLWTDKVQVENITPTFVEDVPADD